MEIIGRERELAAANLFLADAAQRLSVLELHGEAGIGKTTVWRAVLARAEELGFAVLACRSAPAEAKLSFTAVSDLLERVPDEHVEALPRPQRRALDVALLRAEAGDAPVDHRTVAVAVRALLRELAAGQPLLVAVDDLHWLDAASAATLEFALRRLDTEPIGFLAARRADEPATQLDLRNVAPADARSVTVGPLSVAGLHHLLRERLDQMPPRSLLVRIADVSHGNPLFALEIGHLLAEQGAPPPGEPLPVPPDVEALVRRRIAGLPRATREVLLAAAALSDPTEDVVRAALGRSIVRDLEPAERRQIARLEGGVIVFSHPLFAGGVYASATAAERRELHRCLAEVVAGPEARARHLALAADGRDELAAAAAHAAAVEAAARGAPFAAVELAELALALTEPLSDAECLRLLDLAGYLAVSGESERALALLEAVDSWEHWAPNLRASAFALGVSLTAHTEGPKASAELAERALAETIPVQVRASAHRALGYGVGLDDAERALDHAETALALLEQLGEDVDVEQLSAALTLRLRAGAVLGHGFDRSLVDRIRALDPLLPPARVNRPTVSGWFRWVDDLATSRELLEHDLERAEARGHETSRAYVSVQLALTECDAGELARAREHAAAALDLARELELAEVERWAADALAFVETTRGRADEAHGLLRGAEGTPNARAILGRLELSRENYAAADAHLRAVLDLIERAGIGEPGIWRVHADAAEAAVALGDLERAERLAEFLEQHGERTGRRWSFATGARARALVAAARGDLEEALAACERALAHHEELPMPLERARTLLVKGVIERRLRRRGRARLTFEEALAVFEQAGAGLWAERARAELARLGLRRTDSGELTEAERRVAELTARGLTRRDVAAALHLSPKTVDATLGRVYRKLDIHSRAELGARMVELEK